MTSDPISDLLTRIRNAGLALHPSVTMPHSKMKEAVAVVLKQEGYIADFKTAGDQGKTLTLDLKYKARKPVIIGLRQISTPGLRRYVGSTEIPRVLGGLGVAIVSTSKGLMSGSTAKKQNLGGELICYVW
ncbi:MAG TPA: 30S ribosomal protein S8 [Candidatus Limnocylindria bacterium]|jgi:small subunit ribosomal protein S8|nr:30S ribosomal protein S8 [Candidatus Limnocylindria bacterium]